MIVEHWPQAVQEAYILVYNAWLWRSPPLPPQCCCWWCGRARSNKELIPYCPETGPWAPIWQRQQAA